MKTMDRRQLLALTAAVFAFASAGGHGHHRPCGGAAPE
ncbi:MAG: hypothetical protein RLZZ329_1396 [Pseudomonadota bacterium]